MSQGTSNRWAWALLAVLAAVLAIMFYRSGSNPNLWFDESGQFWMAKGLNHYSAPHSADGTVSDLILANQKYNMDPGGYTLILRGWASLGSSPAWLRGLSFLFSILTMAGLGTLGWLWGRKLWSAALGALIACTGIVLMRYSFELRAFSMEACGVAWSLVFLELFRTQKAAKFALAGGLVAALAMTSRYSFLAPAMGVGIAYLVCVWPEGWKQKTKVLAAYGIPVLAMAALIYVGMLKPQNPGGEPPDYVRQFLLKGQSPTGMLKLIGENLLLPGTIGSTLFVIVYLLRKRMGTLASELGPFNLLFIVIVSVTAISAVLSALGKYPWCGSHRWGISLSILSQAGLVALAVAWVRASSASEKPTARFVPIGLGTVFSLAALACAWMIRYKSPDTSYDALRTLPLAQLKPGSVFVNYEGLATLRYHFEYGPLKPQAAGVYPEGFKLEPEKDSAEPWTSFDYLLFGHADRAKIEARLGADLAQFEEVGKGEGALLYKRKT